MTEWTLFLLPAVALVIGGLLAWAHFGARNRD